MCMLCVVQKWSRRVIRVLPWLVIPLITLWALSQLLAPGLQFEITSPRVACLVVLLVTVFWYEVLLPQLTAYWERRSARIRDQQRMQALELQKLRKVATRRCRNCLAIYREQNPGGGKFTCSYCGHVSRRPMLDLPGPPGRSGFFSNLFGNNGWFCSHDCSAEGSENCVGPLPPYWGMSNEEQFMTEKYHSRAALFTWKLFLTVFSWVKWLYRRVLKLSCYGEDGSSDTEQKGLSRKGENGVNFVQGDKGEKARRKAEEKRQARLEKEMLEEEERKQREEVARLVEERRKLRDENQEADKERLKASDGERDNGKESESEKRRHDKSKEKDKSSSRNNSDGEGPEKRGIRVTEKKHEYERKGEAKRGDASNPRTENQKINVEVVNSVKDVANKSKCFDRMEGTLLSSSRTLNGTTSFRKGSHTSAASVAKSGKPIGALVDRLQRRECHAVEHVNGRSPSNGGTKTMGAAHPQHTQTGTLKRSWQQLFTHPSPGLLSHDANTTERMNLIGQPEVQISELLDQKVPSHHIQKQMLFEQSLTNTAYPLMSSSLTGNPDSLVAESIFSLSGEQGHNFTRDGIESLEDPYYAPDPISLIGPVSESLDNFFVDAGSGCTADFSSDHFHNLKNVSDSADANKPSPIASPMSNLWLFEEKRHIVAGPCIPKSQDYGDSPDGESNDINQGTWQMWSSPLCKDLLGLFGAPASGLLGPQPNRGTLEESIHPPVHSPMVSHAVKQNIHQSAFNHSHNVRVEISQNDAMMGSVTPMPAENDLLLPVTVLRPLPGDAGKHFAPFDFNGSASQNEVVCGSAKRSAASQPFDQLPAHCWSKDWTMHGGADIGVSDASMQHIGGLFPSDADVHTVWPLKQL